MPRELITADARSSRRFELVTLALTAVVAIVAAVAGWQRRWMSDDGLIVLRTVRNLMAGNGPVFNVGERVEANTSTLWQYLIYLGAEATGRRLEMVAIVEGVALGAIGLSAAYAASAWYWRRFSARVMVPFGVVIYLALPPARDFLSSGLEWGLSLAWLGILWFGLVAWAQPNSDPLAGGRTWLRWMGPRAGRTLFLSLWAGLSWLIRPEMALYGGLVGLMLMIAARSWAERATILAVALPAPAGYEIFRMGYYGLLVPHTAVAKSAAGSEWGEGLFYLEDFVRPHLLWIPALVVLVCLVALGQNCRRGDNQAAGRRGVDRHAVILAVIWVAAVVHLLYVIRVGGDFMHGRMLLLPTFSLLLPVAAVPWQRWTVGLCAAAVYVWAGVLLARGYAPELPQPGNLRVVDERTFWTEVTLKNQAPIYTEDFLKFPGMRHFPEGVEEARRTHAGVVVQFLESGDPLRFSWMTVPRDPNADPYPPSLTLINLGMTGMNAPLDVRVLDSVGLANPIAARQPRIEGERIGHDKSIPLTWQVADSAADLNQLPEWIDKDEAIAARAALRAPEFQELFASYREPMTVSRFLSNIRFALTTGRTLTLEKNPAVYAPGQ